MSMSENFGYGSEGFDPEEHPRDAAGRFAEKRVTEAPGGHSALPVSDDIRQYNKVQLVKGAWWEPQDIPPTPVSAEQVYDFWATCPLREEGVQDVSGIAGWQQLKVNTWSCGQIKDWTPRVPPVQLYPACCRVGHMLVQMRHLPPEETDKLLEMRIRAYPGRVERIRDLVEQYDCMAVATEGRSAVWPLMDDYDRISDVKAIDRLTWIETREKEYRRKYRDGRILPSDRKGNPDQPWWDWDNVRAWVANEEWEKQHAASQDWRHQADLRRANGDLALAARYKAEREAKAARREARRQARRERGGWFSR